MRSLLILTVALFLTACADPTIMPMLRGQTTADDQRVIVVTNRARTDRGDFGGGRVDAFSYLEAQVSVPADRRMGQVPVSYRQPRPGRHFMFTDLRDMQGADGFRGGLTQMLGALPPTDRDVLIFVHGYNNSFSDGVFRTAQLQHDFNLRGLALHYSWPSAAHPLGYTHDRDSVLIARDGLEQMLRDVARVRPRNIVLVGHSLGAMLVMETLRQMALAEPGSPDRILDGVVLISPDIDLDLFRAQASRIKSLPQPFAIFTSQKDRALQLSGRINGRSERLGAVSQADALGGLDVTVIDVTAFSGGLMGSHFTAGSSPALISLLSQGQALDRTFAQQTRATRGGLPGAVVTVQKATQVILSAGLLRQ